MTESKEIEVTHESEIGQHKDHFDAGLQFVKVVADSDVTEEEIKKFATENYYEPNQVRSAYDCTGESFVQLTTVYKHTSYRDRDKTKWVIEVSWGVDI